MKTKLVCLFLLGFICILHAQTISDRVKAILGQMMLEEKVAQTFHLWYDLNDTQIVEKYGATGFGSVYIMAVST